MSRGVNKAIIIGNACSEPEIRYLTNGNAVTNVTLATNESWKDKQTGQLQERAEFHRVVFFGKIAEIAGEYLRKGSQCYIEGKLQTRKWQGQDGQDRYTTEIVVDQNGTLQLLGGRGDGQQQPRQQTSRQGAGPQQDRPRQAPRQQQPSQQAAPPDYDSFDDDIPFAPLHHLAGA